MTAVIELKFIFIRRSPGTAAGFHFTLRSTAPRTIV